MHRSIVRIVILAALAGAVAYVVYRRLQPDPIPVVVRAVERGAVESTVANTRAGTVKACRRSKLAPPTGGTVWRLPVKKGDHVKTGALLLEIWNEDLQSQLRLAESDATAASARASQACLAADLASREAARIESLFASRIVDEQSRDHATADRDTGRAACEAARADVDQARSRVAVARAALEKSILRAPFDGVVAELNAEEGEVVIPSPPGIPTPPAVDLIEEGCLYVSAPLDEIDGRLVRPGQKARVTLDAFPGRSFPATVRRIAPYVLDVEKQARTLEIEAVIDDPSSVPNLLPGYSADVEVILDRKDGVLRVPAEGISGEGRVLILKEGRLEERKVTLGLSNWQYAEVLSGLSEGDLVVLSLDREGVAAGARARADTGAAR